MSRTLKEVVGVFLVCLIGFGLVQYQHQAHFDPHVAWNGFTLPGFDAHAYVAMAEEPRIFTVAPWGYRILEPALIGAFLPPRLIVPGFDWVARGSLVAACGLLFIYLRIRGATMRAALLAVVGMMLTPSIGAVFENPFLVEPFALALLLIALIAIEGGAGEWVVALSLMTLSLSKEIWVFLLPLVFLKGLSSGARAAGLRTLRIAGPAIWMGLLMRWMWAPQAAVGSTSADYLGAIGAIGSNVAVWAPEFLLGGLALFGLLGLVRPAARAYLASHTPTLALLLALPLVAAAYTGEGAATSFFAGDVKRLLIYAIPIAAALAVHIDPGHEGVRSLPSSPRTQRVAMVIAILLLLAPAALDSYSRVDLSTSRDGPYVLGFARETLKTARRLDRGETVAFDPAERKFAWGVSPPNELTKLRFFLRDGFGPLAHYGIHEIRMRETRATLIIPILEPRPLKLTLTIDARESAWIAVLAGTSHLGEALIGPQTVQATFEIPAKSLFRGDNPIVLLCEKAANAVPRILRIELSARGD